jgi:VWFA-related protein
MGAQLSGLKNASLSAALWIVLSATLLWASDGPDYTIRANSTEVQLEFNVTDKSGHPVLQLTHEDVAVVDNGEVIRQFRSFRRVLELPIHLVVVIDNSRSMSQRLPRILDGISKLLSSNTWGEKDRVTVLAFKDVEVVSLCTLNCQHLGPRVLKDIGESNISPLFDAVIRAAALLQQTHVPQFRSGILIITDGIDNLSLRTSSNAVAAVQNVGAPVYVYGISDGARSDKSELFTSLARLSGGLLLSMQTSITASLQSVLQDMRQCFILSYELPYQPGRRHSVFILPSKDPQLIFRVRLGYGEN